MTADEYRSKHAGVLRIGMVGAGWVTRHHMLAWQAQKDRARVVAIADPLEAKARERASEFGIEHIFADARAMLDSVEMDALDVASPRQTHVAMVDLAAERGIPALCQKPLAPTLAEARELVSRTAGIRLMIHENWRFRDYYRQIRQWLDEELIGSIHQVVMSVLSSGMIASPDGTFPALARQPFMKDLDRLLVMEVLIHHIDTLRYLFGDLELLSASIATSTPHTAGEDVATIMMKGDRGTSILLLGSMAAHGYPPIPTDRLELLGDRGRILLDNGVLSLSGDRDQSLSYDLPATYQDSYRQVISHFIDGLETGAAFETNPADNLRTLELVEEIYSRG